MMEGWIFYNKSNCWPYTVVYSVHKREDIICYTPNFQKNEFLHFLFDSDDRWLREDQISTAKKGFI